MQENKPSFFQTPRLCFQSHGLCVLLTGRAQQEHGAAPAWSSGVATAKKLLGGAQNALKSRIKV